MYIHQRYREKNIVDSSESTSTMKKRSMGGYPQNFSPACSTDLLVKNRTMLNINNW